VIESANAQSPVIWLVREWGMEIYKDGKLVGVIPNTNFPLLISDLALSIDCASAADRARLLAAAAHPDAE
jgi:hypothetical protein